MAQVPLHIRLAQHVRQAGTDDCDPNTPTKMDFYVSNGANISNELMSLNGPSQMVGIGCDDPEAKLQVNTGVSDATIAAIICSI